MALHLDFETFSRCNLIAEGAYRYSTHPSTEPLVASYRFTGGPVRRWLPGMPYPFAGYKGHIHAWNSQFERLIWWHVMSAYGWPRLALERFYCTAAQSRANALPGKLENAAKCLKLRQKKNMAGHRLMLKICVPDAEGRRYEPTTAELFDLYQYCDDDVLAESALSDQLRELSDDEWAVFHAAERINDRGVGVDLEFAKVAVTYADAEREVFAADLKAITKGVVEKPTQHIRVKNWIIPRVEKPALKLMTRYVNDVRKVSCDKAVRHNLLEAEREAPGFLPPDVLQTLELVDLASRSSIAKYRAMVNRNMVTGDGPRLMGLYMPFGAGQTGRFSSVGAQLHNFTRDVQPEAVRAIRAFIAGDEAALEGMGDVITMLAHLLRPTLVPGSGRLLAWGDWSAIEARVLPWLSDDPAADAKLSKFFANVDVYLENVRDLGLSDRQEGKVVELSLGFGGGVGALKAMARGYKVDVSTEDGQRWVWGWRDKNPWAKRFWQRLQSAAMRAIDSPGAICPAGKVSYMYNPNVFNGLGALFCRLPSGRLLTYPNARLEVIETPWGEEKLGITAIKGNWLPRADEKEWPRTTLWYGLQAENITQAVAAELLMLALINCLKAKLDTMAHTHDEILIETTRRTVERHKARLGQIMKRQPVWAKKPIPLDVDVKFGARYKVECPAALERHGAPIMEAALKPTGT